MLKSSNMLESGSLSVEEHQLKRWLAAAYSVE
jgi:hypothetical protein